MNTIDLHPKTTRLVLTILVVLLGVVAVLNFFSYAGSATDENIFADPPSYLLINREFRTTLPADPGQKTGDLIRRGDLLVAVNGLYIKSLSDYGKTIDWISANSEITLFVYRPSTNDRLTFRALRKSIPDSVIVQLPYRFVNVTAITPGGASDRAGMNVGDLIYRINGKTFANAQEADRALRRGKSGNTIAYDIYRDGTPISLNVTLARFGVLIHVLSFFIAGLFYMAFGFSIAYRRPEISGARLMGLAFLLIGYFMAVVLDRRDSDITTFTLMRDITMSLSIFFGIGVMIHSSCYFPKERPELIASRFLPWISYILAAVCSALIFIFNGPFILLSGLSIPLYRLYLGWKYRKQTSPELKKISRFLKFTSLGVALFAVIIGFVVNSNGKQQLIALVGLALLLIPLAHLYSIGRYRLLGLDLRIRRNVRYTLVTVAWTIVIIAAVSWFFTTLPAIEMPFRNLVFTGATIELNDAPEFQDNRLFVQKVLLMILAVGIVVGASHLRRSGQKLIDKRYHRSRYDYRRAAAELSEVMTSKIGMVDLAQGIVRKLAELMQLKHAGVLFFRNEKICCCQQSYGVEGFTLSEAEGEQEGDRCVDVDEQLIQAMKEYTGVFRAEDLPHAVRDRFRKCGYLYIVPIRSKELLIGALLIGEKLAETTLRQDDLDYLMTAATQASVAIENAFLYEELAVKTRLQHELDIARNIQLASLPQKTPAIEGLDIAGISVPAMEVGGDFFDYLDGAGPQDETLTVVVGDVSGKGTSAALYMSRVQGILRSLHEFAPTPADLFTKANRLLCKDLEKHSFVTAFGALFTPKDRSALLARAGHLPLFLFRAGDRTVVKKIPKGIGMGLDRTEVFANEMKEESISYTSGDIFVFVTDGVIEARNGDREEFGEERVVRVLQSHTSSDAGEIRDRILDEVRLFTKEAVQHDDQTVVVVKAR